MTVDRLSFADDLSISSDSLETASKQISQLKAEAAMAGLKISSNMDLATRELEVGQKIQEDRII